MSQPYAQTAHTAQTARTMQTKGWTAIAVALTAMTATACTSAWLVLGVKWAGAALAACVAAIALAAWYALSGRTLGSDGEVRERVLERHYVGVAWYASMLRNTAERGGYERGLRTELTRLSAARLAERRGANLYQDPVSARTAIGADLWPLVDPAGAPKPGQKVPDVSVRAVAELIERLERM